MSVSIRLRLKALIMPASRHLIALFLFSMIAYPILAESHSPSSHELVPLSPISMLPDRLEDSYAIYSLILPVDEFQSQGPEHNQLWLIENTTASMEDALSDIRKCINPPAEDAKDFEQVLKDFDQRKSERVLLRRHFQVAPPYLLLDQQSMKDYWTAHAPNAASQHPDLVKKFQGAPGIMSVSEVYFNLDKTVAAVWIWGQCGSLCGQGYWVALKKVEGKWVKQKWGTCMVMS
jgi:hypothetical protein